MGHSSPADGATALQLPSSHSNSTGGPGHSPASTAPPETRVRRRNRMITSCLECRRRKLKCDKSHPCVNCTKGKRDCIFLAPVLDQASRVKLTEIKDKVGSLERLLEKGAQQAASGSTTLPADVKDEDIPQAEDEKDLEPTPLAVVDAVYEDDADDDLLDLGIQIGRMRLTERIGGFFRPRLAQELHYSLYDTAEKAIPSPDNMNTTPSGVQTYQYLMPSPAYIAPASGFIFGHSDKGSSLIDYLPTRLAADRLVKQYFTVVHPVAHLLHYPSFEKEYENFWEDISLGIEPPTSMQAIVFAAMFSGVVSMSEMIILRDFGVPKDRLIDNFKSGTETALSKSHFLRTTKVETLQAFVMYLVSQWTCQFLAPFSNSVRSHCAAPKYHEHTRC